MDKEQIDEIAMRVAQDFIANRGTERAYIADGWIPVPMREFLEELAKVSDPVGYLNGRSSFCHVDSPWVKANPEECIPLYTTQLPQPDLVAEIEHMKRSRENFARSAEHSLQQLSAAQADSEILKSQVIADEIIQSKLEIHLQVEQADNEQLLKALEWCKCITDWTEIHRHVNEAIAANKARKE